ncbi:hypothetical protein Tco_0255328 [Tanacetum coccineum]
MIDIYNISYEDYLEDFDYESDPRFPLILGRPFLRTARALIDVHGEELILRDGDERLILNMKHDTSNDTSIRMDQYVSFLLSLSVGTSVLYEDFSEVDTLTLIDNEDKVFNPGILVHENHNEVTNRVTPDKNVKKKSSSNASLILRDYPDYEASRARGFVHRSLELHILSFIIGIEYPNLID